MKRAISVILLLCLMLSTGSVAFAAADVQQTTEVEGISLTVGDVVSFESDPPDDNDVQAVQSLIDSNQYNEMEEISIPMTRSYNAVYSQLSDYITTQGQITPYGIITLGTNQVLQVGLECPNNINMDYDLYIAEVTAQGGVGTILDGSQYTTHVGAGMNRTVDEGVCYINTSASAQNYCILVHSKVGGGEMFPYTLYFSIDATANCNSNETDQNAANPCIVMNPDNSASGFILNSPADVDWIAINVNVGTAYSSADIDIVVTDPTTGAELTTDSVELYQHIGGNKLQLVNKENGVYNFTPEESDEYYLRVMPGDRSNFSWHTYGVATPVEAAYPGFASVGNLKFTTDTDTSGTNYVRWPEFDEPMYCVYNASGDWLQVSGSIFGTDGNLLQNSNYTVKLEFENQYWLGKNDSFAHVQASATANANGTFSVRISNMPPPAGMQCTYYNPYSNIIHYYDLAIITVRVFDTNNSQVFFYQTPAYHHSHGIQGS